MNQMDTLLVTGVSGQLAGRVVAHLIRQGHRNIIGTTRRPEKAAGLKDQGVELRQANFDLPETLTEAFGGAKRMLLVSTNKIGQRLHQHKNAIEAARKAGIQHIVYTSIQNADRFTSTVTEEHLGTEKLLKESGLHYTILRNNLYTDGLLMKVKPAVQWGFFGGCAADGAVAYVTREDCARAAAHALLKPVASQSVLDISGGKAMTYADIARYFSKVAGKNIEYKNESPEDFKSALQKFGIPEGFAAVITDFDNMAREGHLAQVGSAFKELTGVDAEDAESFLQNQPLPR